METRGTVTNCETCNSAFATSYSGQKEQLTPVEYIFEIPGHPDSEPIFVIQTNDDAWKVCNWDGDNLDQKLEWHRQDTPVCTLTLDDACQLAERYVTQLLNSEDGTIYSHDDVCQFVMANFDDDLSFEQGMKEYCINFIWQYQHFFVKLRSVVKRLAVHLPGCALRICITGDPDYGGRELVVTPLRPQGMTPDAFLKFFYQKVLDLNEKDNSRCRVIVLVSVLAD